MSFVNFPKDRYEVDERTHRWDGKEKEIEIQTKERTKWIEKQKELIIKYFDGEGRLTLSTILKDLSSRMEIIVTFLAVLDLIRDGICSLEQKDVFGEIELLHLSVQA